MDIQYTATTEVATTEPFACGKCGYVGAGRASAVASATVAQGGFVFENDRAGEMARDEAEARAWQEALSDVPMAPCPRCGAVKRSAWVAWLTSGRVGTRLGGGTLVLVFGLTFLAFSYPTAADDGTRAFIGMLAIFGSVAWLLLLIDTIGAKFGSTKRVRFEPPR